ncbi:hypothetical protein CTheo_7361 [Ceratobasidium theobromae]|uniref:Uncharacterized protein n=1 Tax=Ceratobasidium theobromae TaxID=1582974 RepID=A0A5N5QCF0_9AGAM|nr:hypothetical protein CTheo_7361 [Ceratobasidium theobromae]
MPAVNSLSALPAPTAAASSPTKHRGGCGVGAVKWSVCEYLCLFRVIATVCPQGSADWKTVGLVHSEGPTKQSGETCKSCWNPILKMPKPTGKAKVHPLHRLALSIDDHMNKARATQTLNDAAVDLDEELFSSIDVEFDRAKRELTHLGLDLDAPPNFNHVLEDTVDGEGDMDREDDANNTAEFKGTPNGKLVEEEVYLPKDVHEDTQMEPEPADGVAPAPMLAPIPMPVPTPMPVAMPTPPPVPVPVPVQPAAAAQAPVPIPAPIPVPAPVQPAAAHPLHHSPPWDIKEATHLQVSPKVQATLTSLFATCLQPSPKATPALFPLKPSAAIPSMSTSASGKPKLLVASGTLLKSPSKSKKRKAPAADEEVVERVPKWESKPKASGSKGSQPKVEVLTGEGGIIDLTGDNLFVEGFMNKKQVNNLNNLAMMDRINEIQSLRTQLASANERIRDLEIMVKKYKLEAEYAKRVQDAVAAELAQCAPKLYAGPSS